MTIQKPDAENNLKVIGGNAHSRDEAVKRLMLGQAKNQFYSIPCSTLLMALNAFERCLAAG